MVEANRFRQPVLKGKKKAGKGKKGKAPSADEEAQFERDLAQAIEASRIEAGLQSDFQRAQEESKVEEQKASERRNVAAQEAYVQEQENLHIDIPAECPVCMLIIARPTQLPCKHIYCQGCAQASLNFRWECPMCRQKPSLAFSFRVSRALISKIKAQVDPEDWKARIAQIGGELEESEEEKEGEERPDVQEEIAQALEDPFELEIKYGNRHRLIPNAPLLKNGKKKNHEWVCFVQLNTRTSVKAQDLIQEVMFSLPACYKNRYREIVIDGTPACRNAKSYFECKETGWGTVNVQMEIKFRDDLPYPVRNIRLQHITSFKPQGETKIHKVTIPRTLAEQKGLVARRRRAQ